MRGQGCDASAPDSDDLDELGGLDDLDELGGDYLDLAISLATGCAGIAPTHIAPDNDDDDNDDNDEPEVLSAARHAQHDQPGQTHARQPANDSFISIILFISIIVFYLDYSF